MATKSSQGKQFVHGGQPLASIFVDHDAPRDLAGRGPDLEATVRVAPAALGKGPVRVELPDELETPDGPVRRMRSRNDPPGTLQLNLPDDLPEIFRLRLRGQGGAGRSAHGDLLLTVLVRSDALVARQDGPPSGLRLATAAGWLVVFLLAAWLVAWLATM